MRSLGLGFYLSVAMLPVMIILTIIFVLKKKVNNEETKIYSYILITSIIMTLLEIVSAILYKDYLDTFAYNLIAKFVLVSYIMVNFLFCNYLMTVCKRPKSRVNIMRILSLIVLILTLLTTTKYVEVDGSVAPQGIPVMLTYVYALTVGIYQLILAIINRKTIASKKFTPFYLFLVFGAINALIIYFYPTSFMVGYIWCLTIIVMNFTIENPDVKMLKQVELAKDQAERANRAKSDFLSSMSHEIRTPLNAIVGFSEDIQSHKDTADPEIVEDADYILEASQTLLEIVGNILDINKIEANKMEITEVPYNFRKEIESLAKVDAVRIGEKNINFKLNIASDIPYELIGDKAHIKEIINNLLTNAIKYTEQGDIELTAKCINQNNNCNLIISVRDTGRGIKAENISKLFTKFERLDIEKNSTTEGTGLGLAITKALVDMMGGKINVQSQFGQGSLFVVQIPQKISKMTDPNQTVEINITSPQQITNETKEEEKQVVETPQPVQQPIEQPVQTSNNSSSSSNKKILIVDDSKINIKVARKALQDFNFEIDECYDGQECLDKLPNGNEYDLILMDIMMPNMSGETAIAKLKEKPNFSIPTIALTADAVAGAREKYLSEGFVDYIAKPFNKDQIKEKLDLIFNNNSDNSSTSSVKEETSTEELEQEVETPKYDPNVDRFKDVPAYVVGSEDNNDNS